jgi:hypothetical protein
LDCRGKDCPDALFTWQSISMYTKMPYLPHPKGCSW